MKYYIYFGTKSKTNSSNYYTEKCYKTIEVSKKFYKFANYNDKKIFFVHKGNLNEILYIF